MNNEQEGNWLTSEVNGATQVSFPQKRGALISYDKQPLTINKGNLFYKNA